MHSIRFVGRILKLFFDSEKASKFPPLEPDIIIDDSFDLSEYGIKGKVISTPGHTLGSVSVILENGDAIVGDLLIGSFSSKKPSLPFWADDLEELKRSIGKLIKYAPKKVYIAHFGGPYSLADLKGKFRV